MIGLLVRLVKGRRSYVDPSQMDLFGDPQSRGLTPHKVMVQRSGARPHMQTVWKRDGDPPYKPEEANSKVTGIDQVDLTDDRFWDQEERSGGGVPALVMNTHGESMAYRKAVKTWANIPNDLSYQAIQSLQVLHSHGGKIDDLNALSIGDQTMISMVANVLVNPDSQELATRYALRGDEAALNSLYDTQALILGPTPEREGYRLSTLGETIVESANKQIAAARQEKEKQMEREMSLNENPSGAVLNDIPYNVARRAFNWVSFNPDRRATQEREEYVSTMNADYESLKAIAEKHGTIGVLDSEFPRYREGYVKRVLSVLDATSRTMSPMITGPARFPVKKAEAANRVEHDRIEELVSYHRKVMNRLKRELNPETQPIVAGALSRYQEKLAVLEKKQEFMKRANVIIRSKDTDEAKVFRLKEELGMSDEYAQRMMAPDQFGHRGGFSPHSLSINNADIKWVKEKIVTEKRRMEEKANPGDNAGWTFDGGEVELDYDGNRIRIRHEQKPGPEVIAKLKSRGFRWSPKNKAWQRQLTENAKQAALNIVGGEQ